MPKSKDISGQKFGRLTALYKLHNCMDKRNARWLCVCDRGNLTEVTLNNLQRHHTQSCGCYRKYTSIESNITHGKRNTRLYNTWAHMKQRCYNKNNKRYNDYGGRSIKVCDEWKDDFQAFYDWAMNNGYKDNLTIDRIDVNGSYSPDNCRWITNDEQQRNKRNTKYVTYKGVTKSLTDWCESLGLNYDNVKQRLYHGWTIEKSLEIEK